MGSTSDVSLNGILAMRLQQFELIFIRLLHLLAHHPDFAVNAESLPDLAKFVPTFSLLVVPSHSLRKVH